VERIICCFSSAWFSRFFQGRLHFYEGNTFEEVTRGITMFAEMGVDTVVVTNAAGAINPNFQVGDVSQSHCRLFFSFLFFFFCFVLFWFYTLVEDSFFSCLFFPGCFDQRSIVAAFVGITKPAHRSP
jgi:hypothetical protein